MLFRSYFQGRESINRNYLAVPGVVQELFNRFAERIARFDEVESCYLMSGGYDLLVFVRGGSLQKVAAFVSEKLSTVEGVLSTSTHFMLRCYKEQGFLLDGGEAQTARLNVAP